METENGESKMARKLRADDKICCADGSFSFGIKNGVYDRCSMTNCNNDRDNLRVIATGLDVKQANYGLSDDVGHCDTLVTDDLGNYWFVLERLCRLLPEMHTITINGKNIVISNDSYENLKAGLL